MPASISRDLAALEQMSTAELRGRYAEVFGESTNANNRIWLLKRIAWRLQSNAEGSLSERARQRAEELARDADIRLTPPRTAAPIVTGSIPPPDTRLPPPGTVLTRPYKGRTLRVTVLPAGFEFEGTVYTSLSAVARAITGSHCNGYLFFKLATPGDRS